MTSRSSFPFLQLARQLDVPYATVLLAADWYVKPLRALCPLNGAAVESLRPSQRTAVLDTVSAEHRRRLRQSPPAGGEQQQREECMS